MKLLFLTSEFPPRIGGVASHVHQLARSLGRAGHVVDVFTRDADPDRRVPDEANVTVHRVAMPVSAKPVYDLVLRRWLRRHLARNRPDLVHVHGMRPLAASRVCRDIPVLFTNHTSGFLAREAGSERRRRKGRDLLRHLAAIIAPSQELADTSRSIGYPGPCHVIPNGVDVERFAPDAAARTAARHEYGIADETPVILLARRLVEKNGVCDFAVACGHLADAECSILIAGDGPERPATERLVAEAGMSARVGFLGAVANDRMPALYNAADLVVLPSLAEATSIAGLEAMATGLPLVGTSVGGIPEIIAPGTNGLLVPPGDPEALAAAIATLLGSADTRHAFGDAARKRAVAEFSWPSIAMRTEAVYREVLDARAAAAPGAPAGPVRRDPALKRA